MCPKCEPLELTREVKREVREVKVLNGGKKVPLSPLLPRLVLAPLEAEFPSLLSPKNACNPKSDEELDAKVRPLLFSLAPVPA